MVDVSLTLTLVRVDVYLIVVVTTVVDSPWPRVYVRVVSSVLVMVLVVSPSTGAPVLRGTEPVPCGTVLEDDLIG